MKLFRLTTIALLAFGSFAQAQYHQGPSYYINTGMAIPSSPDAFSDYWKAGFNIGGGIGYPVSKNVDLIGTIIYSSFGFDGEKLMADNGMGGYGFQVDGGNASLLTINADFKASLGSDVAKARPFFIGGAGIFRMSIDEATISYLGQSETVRGDNETKLGIDIGAGLDINLSQRTKLFLAAKYIVGFTEDESTQYFPLQIGLIFR